MTILQGLLSGVSQGILTGVLGSGGAFISLVNNGQLSPLFTFTRASSQTYIDSDGLLKEIGTDVPAIDYSQGFAALSLWEGSTNLTQYSQDLTQFSLTSVTVSQDATNSPQGTLNADKIEDDGTSTTFRCIGETYSLGANTVCTVSCFVKAGEYDFFYFRTPNRAGAIGNENIAFNLANGTVTHTASGWTSRIENYGNGWYRVSATANMVTLISMFYGMSPTAVVDDTLPSYAGTVGNGLFIWGLQFETKSFPTPLIFTNGSTASRAAPSVSIRGTNFNFFNAEEGTFLLDYIMPYELLSSARLIAINNGGGSERILLFESNSTSNISYIVTDGGVTQAFLDAGVASEGARKKTAFKYKADDFALSATGGTLQTDTTGTLPTVDRLFLGQDVGGTNPNNVYVANVTYYPLGLANSDLELQVATFPENTVLPAVTGTTGLGDVLSTTDGTWTGSPTPSYSYQWRRDGVNISGATSNTYTIVLADDNADIDCVVRATNIKGLATATSNAVTVDDFAVPSAFVSGDWSIAAGDTQATVTISSLPTSNPAITDIEYRVDSGSWVSSGVSTTTTFDITGLTNGVQVTVELRAVNAIGNSADSDDKTVTPAASAGSFLATDWSNIGLHLEATDSNSYGGSGQIWTDLVNGIEFYLGSSASGDGAEPTFNGTAGTSGAYFSFDGNDYFLEKDVATLIDDIHKTNTGMGITIMLAIQTPGSAGSFTAGTANANGEVGFRIRDTYNSTGYPIDLYNGTGRSFVNPTTGVLGGGDEIIFITFSADRTSVTVYHNATSGSATFTGLGSITADATSNLYLGSYTDETSGASSGTRIRSFAIGTGEITAQERADVVTALNSQHGVTYYTP